MKIAIVGATGLVGSKMLQILEERNFPVQKLFRWPPKNRLKKKLHLKIKITR